MGSGGSQVSIPCNIDGVMEYCTLPPAGPTPGPSWCRGPQAWLQGRHRRDSEDPCPLPSAPLTSRPFTWGPKATPSKRKR